MAINDPTDLFGVLEGETIGRIREKNSKRVYLEISAADEQEIY